MASNNYLRAKRDRLKSRLDMYLQMEADRTAGKVQSYVIDKSSVTYKDYSMKELVDIIDALQGRIDEIEGLLAGRRPRLAVGIVPRDDY